MKGKEWRRHERSGIERRGEVDEMRGKEKIKRDGEGWERRVVKKRKERKEGEERKETNT